MRYAVTSIFFALCFALASSLPVRAEEMTRTQADAIISELRQIRSLLEKLQPGEVVTPTRTPAAPARPPRGAATGEKIRVAVGNIEALGRSDAPVTIVEFTDYQCPFCRQFHVSTFEQLKTQYIDTGKVRYVSRDLPLAIHPQAVTAAHAARCAGDQKKFWEMRHVVVVNANHLAPEKYVTFARDLHLDADRFQSCMATDKYKSDIQRDLSDAQAAGISGTPTFVVGRTQSDGAIEGHKIVGAQPYATFEARLKELLTTMGPGAGSE